MITLKSLPCDEFLVNVDDYKSCPTKSEAKIIRWIESQIIQNTTDFRSRPHWFISEWERLTEGEMPRKYTENLPREVVSLISAGKGKGFSGEVEIQYLPTNDDMGKPLVYDENRMLSDFLRFGMKVYVLKDSIYNQLAVA